MSLLGAGLLGAGPVLAQSRSVTLRGSLTVSTDLYGQSGRARNTRSPQMAGAYGQVTVALPGGISMPFSAYLSTEGAGYQHPFNQVGVSPRWRWAQAHGGYFSTRLSNFTLSDARLLGGGLELTPGPFRLGVAYGQAQRALESDTVLRRLPLYERRLTAVQIGVGQESGWHLWLSGMHAADDSASLRRPTLEVTPQSNVVLSTSLGGRLGRFVRLGAELAASGWNENTLADTVSFTDPDAQAWADRIRPFLPVSAATRVDVASTGRLDLMPTRTLTLGLQTQFVGPGFRSLGAQQVETDVFDMVIAPVLRLPKLQLSGRAGLRHNNVAGTRLETQRRALYALNAVAQLHPTFTLALDGSNYGLRATREADTLRLASVSRSFSVAPTYTRRRGSGATHTLSGAYGYQDFVDENTTSGRETATRNHTMTVSHTFARRSGLRLTTSGTYVNGLTQGLESTIWTLSENVQHRLRDGKLTVGGGATLSLTQLEQTDRGLMLRGRASYRLTPKTSLEATSTGRFYRYGAPRAGSDGFREGTFRLAYSYSF